MIKVGITGQSGFIGTHLFNYLGLNSQEFQRIPFQDDFFSENEKIADFVSQCDVIVHLAALNRHNDPEIIYKTNLRLVSTLIDACESVNAKPHIIFSSSTQEERDNLYGKSKKDGRLLFEQWAKRNQATFTGLLIPNVFGPFGHPHYNSVVATFCHQITHDVEPKIEIDGELKLIYVGELVKNITNIILNGGGTQTLVQIAHSVTSKVSEILARLKYFKEIYVEKGILPDLTHSFDHNLFNTFLCYIDFERFFPFQLKLNTDERGSFVETVRLHSGGQVSFSTTRPGITRGNHFHTRKAERFAVIKGKARIELRRIGTNKVFTFDLNGNQPSFVDMPVWHTHNITNTGNDDLYTIFWINEHFEPSDPDTFFEQV